MHQAFQEILRFWFDRGVAGFRIDVAQGLYKDAQLRDDPPAPEGELVRSRFGLAQVYSANRPESHGVFRDWRKIAESYPVPRVLLGETWVGDLDALAAFHGHGDELQLTFNFPFIFSPFTAEALAAVVAETLAKLPAGECAVWTSSNHDISRFPTRWCGGDERRVRLALLVLSTLPGALVLYYGDELGMTDVDVPAELVRDKMRAEAGARESRDRSRTPMRWDSSPSGGSPATVSSRGCRTATPPGVPLRISKRIHRPSCTCAATCWPCGGGNSPASWPATSSSPGRAGVWVYETGGLTVAANFSDEPATLDASPGAVLLATGEGALDGLVLQPWAGVIARSRLSRPGRGLRPGLRAGRGRRAGRAARVAPGVPLAVTAGVGLADGVATAEEPGRCGEFSAAWSASAMASWPMAVGWNGAGSPRPCTYGWVVHSWWPVKSGLTEVKPNSAAPLASTAFRVASRELSVRSLAAVRPTWPRQASCGRTGCSSG